jgi:hypothetical protein
VPFAVHGTARSPASVPRIVKPADDESCRHRRRSRSRPGRRGRGQPGRRSRRGRRSRSWRGLGRNQGSRRSGRYIDDDRRWRRSSRTGAAATTIVQATITLRTEAPLSTLCQRASSARMHRASTPQIACPMSPQWRPVPGTNRSPRRGAKTHWRIVVVGNFTYGPSTLTAAPACRNEPPTSSAGGVTSRS